MEIDELEAILNAPSADEQATEWNAMVASSDHNGLWTMSTGPAAEHHGDIYGEWMSRTSIPDPKRNEVGMKPTVALVAGQMRSRTAVPTLLRWLGDEKTTKDTFLRECILYALGQIGDKRAAQAVKSFETHAEEWTRFFAREAGARIAGRPDNVTPRWSKPRMNLISVNLTEMYGKMVEEVFHGTIMETRDKALTGELINDGLVFDDNGEPLYDVALLWFVELYRSSPLLMWRLHHYARRGGQVILDGQYLFWIYREYEMIGEGDAAIRGKLKREYRYQRGPWDELYPEKLEKNPAFPPLDDHVPMFKDFFYGYRRIGRGGCLMMSGSDHTLDVAIKNIAPIRPVPYWTIPNANALQQDIFTWLRDGPEHREASVGWRNESLKPQPFFAGATAKVVASFIQHQRSTTPVVPEMKLFAPDGKQVGAVTGESLSGRTGEWKLLDLAMDLPILTLPDPNYRLEISARDASGKVLHRMDRLVEVRGRFEIAMEGWPAMIAGEALVPAKVQIKDGSTGPHPPLQARLRLVNDDFNRVYRIWQAPWNGQDDIALDMLLPGTLPAAQYSLRADLVDEKDQIYGRLVKPLARQAIYEQRRIFQWSEWIQAGMGAIADSLHKVGINTTAGNGWFISYPGVPYEWCYDTTDVFVQPERPGDHYLSAVAKSKKPQSDPYRFERPALQVVDQPHGRTEHYINWGTDARKVSRDMIEEIGMQDLSWGYNYMLQLEYMLQGFAKNINNLNQQQGSDILSWEELPFARFKTGFGMTAEDKGWVFYSQRSATIHTRSLAVRERNPYIRVEAGQNNFDWHYDGLHTRFYDGNILLPAVTLLREIPSHPRAAKTWLMDFKNDYTYSGQARKIWASIAGNGRHITLFQSGGHFPANGAWWWGLTSLSNAIHSVRPYEPILIDTRNRISPDIVAYGPGGKNPVPVNEMLLALGIVPDVVQNGSYMARIEGEKDVAKYRIILDGNNKDIRPEQVAAIRRAVENGAVLISTPRGSPAIAAEFGVEVRAGEKNDVVKRVDLNPLARLLPGVRDAWLYGKLGSSAGVTAKGGLTAADGLIFGQVGKGLFIRVNVESEFCGLAGRSGDDSPWDYEGWTQFWLAVLERQGLAQDVFRVVDSAGRTDRRAVCRILDTDDGSQRYLLMQVDRVLEGSLSNWDIDARVKQAVARFAPDKPVTFKAGMAPITLKFKSPDAMEGQVWIRRKVSTAPGKPEYTLRFSMKRDGKDYDPPGIWGKPGGARLRAEVPADGYVWEAAGPSYELFGGSDYELTFEPGEREVEVDRIVVLPSIVTARIVIADPRIVALYDVRDDRSYPVVETKGQRHVDVSCHAGVGVVLGLVEAPAGKFVARIASPEVGRGGSLRVDCELQGPDGKPLARSATLCGTLRRGAKKEPVPNSFQHQLLEGGKGTFEYWIMANESEGPATLEVLNMANGQRVELPLTIRDVGGNRNPLGIGWTAKLDERPKQHILHVDPLPDLRVPDIGIVDLAGTFTTGGDEPLKLELCSAIPDNCFPGGKASCQFTAAPGTATRFSVPVIIARRTARQIQRRDLTIPVWLKTPDGTVVARQNVRLLTNPWDVAPPVINGLIDGSALLIVTNA
ncbi:MAG: HEAT repeat domain-containing protein, partial [Lentisphaerae bacterium]|nr:HEAT repeat domain-containing protein [Lentisphaerota bacterium]